jgi:hypothetical protein
LGGNDDYRVPATRRLGQKSWAGKREAAGFTHEKGARRRLSLSRMKRAYF